ncbi:hypothetical protein A6I85_24210 [Prescottella equi]|nr:hypothetical protein A6I85_24210 [Prescottella equi]
MLRRVPTWLLHTITAAQSTSSRRFASTGSSVVYGSAVRPFSIKYFAVEINSMIRAVGRSARVLISVPSHA